MRYNYFTWWLSVGVKPLSYRIWKYVATHVLFIAWVVFVAVYQQQYWQFSLCAILPAVAVDLIWNTATYVFYRKKIGAETVAESIEEK